MLGVLARPAIVIRLYSRSGQDPGRFAVLPSTISVTAPTGAPAIVNWPWASVWATREVSRMRRVTPAIGVFVLSSTTPLTDVADAGPAARPVATKAATGLVARPEIRADTALLAMPSAGSSTRGTITRPSPSETAVRVLRAIKK